MTRLAERITGILELTISVNGKVIAQYNPIETLDVILCDGEPSKLLLTAHLDPAAGKLFAHQGSEEFPTDAAIDVGLVRDGSRHYQFRGRVTGRRLKLDQGGWTFEVSAEGVSEGASEGSEALTIDCADGILEAELSHPGPGGTLLLEGVEELVPGRVLRFENFGEPWDGNHTIAAAHHTVAEGIWRCKVSLGN